MATLAEKAAAAPLAARRPTVAAPQYEYSYPYGPTGPALKRLVGSAPTGAADKYTQDQLAGKYGTATQADAMKRQSAAWGPQQVAPVVAPAAVPGPRIGQPASGSSGGLPTTMGAQGGSTVSFGDALNRANLPTTVVNTKQNAPPASFNPKAATVPTPAAAPTRRDAWNDRIPSATIRGLDNSLPSATGGVNQ